MKILKIYGNYDGSQIKPLWVKEKFNIEEDNIVVMIGAMDVKFENMIDKEDLENKKEIKGDECIHFLIEHYDSEHNSTEHFTEKLNANLRLAYYRQRLFVCCVEEILKNFKIFCERRGDDLYINKKKLSVSIATVGKTQKIHFGINLSDKGTPSDVETIGLKDLNLSEKDIEKFIDDVLNLYIDETKKIENDIKKTKIF